MSSNLSPILSSGDSTPACQSPATTNNCNDNTQRGTSTKVDTRQVDKRPPSVRAPNQASVTNKNLSSMLALVHTNNDDDLSEDEDERERELHRCLGGQGQGQGFEGPASCKSGAHLSADETHLACCEEQRRRRLDGASSDRRDQLRRLIRAASKKRERVAGKLQQILKSVPLITLTIATTSIMFVLVVCLLLLLSNPSSTRAEAPQQQHLIASGADEQDAPIVATRPGERAQQPPLSPSAHDRQAEQSAALVSALGLLQRQAALSSFLSMGARPERRQVVGSKLAEAERAHSRAPLGRSEHRNRRNSLTGAKRLGGALEYEEAPLDDEQRQQQAFVAHQADAEAAGDAWGPPVSGSLEPLQHHNHEYGAKQRSEPAHLRASPLELELAGDGDTGEQPVSVHRQQAVPARHRQQHSEQQQQQQQHHLGNHERAFDVPQIECNSTDVGFERFACPSPDKLGRYRCIEDRLFCDGYYDCPNGEDEHRLQCMFFKVHLSHSEILTNTFVAWMKAVDRKRQATVDNLHETRSNSLGLD